jgi:trigger factor
VEVPVEKVNAAFDDVAVQFQKAAQLPGFRPGKAPRHLIQKSYESNIREEARKKLVEGSFRDAAAQEKLEVVVTLNVEEQQFGRNQALQFTATVEVAPEFVLPSYKGLAAKRELRVATDADVDRALGILREQQAKFEDVQRPIQEGDVAVVSYVGTCDGQPLTALSPTAMGLTAKENSWMLVRPGSFIPGFTEPLVGASVGDKRTIPLTLPADFVHKELAGKNVVYEVTVTGVKQKVLPEADDAFAKSFGADTMSVLLQGIRTDLQRELDMRQKKAVRDQLLKALMAQLEFDLPESIVASETRSVVYNIVNENQQRGVPKEVIEEKKDEIYQNAAVSARDRVKGAFILNRIAAAEKLSVSDREMTQRVLLLAQQNNTTPEKMVKAIQERNAAGEVRQDILVGKVLEFLEINAVIEDVAPLPEAPAAS